MCVLKQQAKYIVEGNHTYRYGVSLLSAQLDRDIFDLNWRHLTLLMMGGLPALETVEPCRLLAGSLPPR